MARIGYPRVCTFRPGTDPTAITRTGFALNATDAGGEYGPTGNPAGP